MDADYVVVDRAESSVVTTPDHQVVTVVTVEPTVITDEMLSYVTTISTDTQVVAAGQQGPAGRDGIDGSTTAFTLEAGENLSAGTPVKVVADKVYAVDQASDPTVVAVVRDTVLATFSAILITNGPVTLTGLTPATPYFAGFKSLTATCPSSGYVIRVGSAVSSTVLLVNIEEPILLS